MNKKWLLFIVTILIVFISTGCWDYTEFENMALVSALGIDMDEQSGQITVSVQYTVPGGNSGGDSSGSGKSKKSTPAVSINIASGASIDIALTKLQQIIGKRIFLGYTDVEIIGEDAAKNIMDDIVEMSDRTPEIRTNTYILIASGKAADAISTVEPDISVTAGKHIHELVRVANTVGSVYPVIIQDIIEDFEIRGIEAAVPHICTIANISQDGKSESNDPAVGSLGHEGKVKQNEGYHKIDGMAVFKKEKLVGWLDSKESKGLAWITGKNITPYENLKTSGDADTKSTLIFRVKKNKSKIKIVLNNETPVVNISIYVEADLRKYAITTEVQALTPYAINIMQEGLENEIRSDVEAAIQKVQKDFKSDVFGLGQVFYRQHLSLWRNTYQEKWDEVFPDLTVNVKVQAKVINTGTNIMKFIFK